MKKHTLLIAVLGLASLEMHSNVFGNKKPFSKLNEEQLDLIESALKENDTTALTDEITQLKADLAAAKAEKEAFDTAVNQALELNGLGLEEEEATSADAVTLLGDKCKEYGDAKPAHSITPTDGEDKFEGSGLLNGYFDPNAAHNQL